MMKDNSSSNSVTHGNSPTRGSSQYNLEIYPQSNTVKNFFEWTQWQ